MAAEEKERMINGGLVRVFYIGRNGIAFPIMIFDEIVDILVRKYSFNVFGLHI